MHALLPELIRIRWIISNIESYFCSDCLSLVEVTRKLCFNPTCYKNSVVFCFSKSIKSVDKTTLEDRLRPGDVYLQKTLPGGIMLIELGFREVYFCVNVYAFECSRLAKAVVSRPVCVELKSKNTKIT